MRLSLSAFCLIFSRGDLDFVVVAGWFGEVWEEEEEEEGEGEDRRRESGLAFASALAERGFG